MHTDGRRPFACLLILGLAVIPRMASGQTRNAAEIEARLKAKLAKPEYQTTAGMVEAYDEAVKAYRAEVARVFEKLMKGLPKPQADALADSHRAWLKYLESARTCVSYVYDAPGTIHKPVAMLDLKAILQHRLDEMCQMFLEWDTSEDPSNPERVPGKTYWCDHPPHERIVSDSEDPLGPSPLERKFLSPPDKATKQKGR